MSRKEEGMTILEVVIAITILLIGTTFIVQSNSLSYKYLREQELRQQMIFFAAGRMEAALEGVRTFESETDSPYDEFETTYSDHTNDSTDETLAIPEFPDGSTMPLLPFKISISVPGFHTVEMYNYKVNLR